MTLLRTLRYLVAAALLLPLASVASAQKEKGKCAVGEVQDPKSGKCAAVKVCGPDQVRMLNKCFPKCAEGMTMDNEGKCRGCPTGQVQDLILGKCFTKCPDGSKRDTKGGCPKSG